MAHTEKELKSYKDKAQELTSIFGEKSLKVVEQITTTLENLLAWDDSEFTAVELGYWYNVEAELKKEPEEEFLKDFEFLSTHFIYNPKTFCFKSRRKQIGGSVGDDRGNLLLLVETYTSKFFILNYTNELGFDEITKEVFIKYLNQL